MIDPHSALSELRNCCFCISIEIGVMILGCFVWFSLLGEFDYFNPVRACITVATGSLFLNMVFKDSKQNREYFLYAFIVHLISELIFGVNQAYAKIEEKNMIELQCEDMQKKH